MALQDIKLFGENHPGRIATLPARFLAITLFVTILIIELVFFSLDLCGMRVPVRSMIINIVIVGAFVGLEWWEQRTFLTKPPFRLAVGLIVAKMILMETSGLFDCSGFYQFFGLIPPLIAYLYIGRRAAIITVVISILITVQWVFLTSNGYNFSIEQLRIIQVENNVIIDLSIYTVGLVVILVMGWVLTQEEQNRERANRLLKELEASQMKLTELAKVNERNRIARDIHDTVGHHLTAINIQIEKAQAFRAINPAEADQALIDAKRSAQSALADVRDSVSALRDQDRQFELRNGLVQLVEGFHQVPTTLYFDGDESQFSKASLIALYRVAQEGLTNIGKHAQATSAELTVKLTSNLGKLILKDNGVGLDEAALQTQQASKEAHFGLLGLQERLELVGGTLQVKSEVNKGTTLEVRVPARGLDERD
ncbi:MAG: sensor histidine kinase [Chloroflexota bacterium]